MNSRIALVSVSYPHCMDREYFVPVFCVTLLVFAFWLDSLSLPILLWIILHVWLVCRFECYAFWIFFAVVLFTSHQCCHSVVSNWLNNGLWIIAIGGFSVTAVVHSVCIIKNLEFLATWLDCGYSLRCGWSFSQSEPTLDYSSLNSVSVFFRFRKLLNGILSKLSGCRLATLNGSATS